MKHPLSRRRPTQATSLTPLLPQHTGVIFFCDHFYCFASTELLCGAGMLFQYIISEAALQSKDGQGDHHAELHQPLTPKSESTWQAVLLAMIEHAVANDVNLRRRVAVDSLKDSSPAAQNYIKALVNSVF